MTSLAFGIGDTGYGLGEHGRMRSGSGSAPPLAADDETTAAAVAVEGSGPSLYKVSCAPTTIPPPALGVIQVPLLALAKPKYKVAHALLQSSLLQQSLPFIQSPEQRQPRVRFRSELKSSPGCGA